MSEDKSPPPGPDLAQGVSPAELHDGKLLGHVGDDAVLLVRSGEEFLAIGAHCSHYHGPLADGLVVDGSIRCPWHHACFDLRSGEAVRAPATFPLDVWNVEQVDGKLFVREKRAPGKVTRKAPSSSSGRIVIVGGGAAGFAAAEMLRRHDFDGGITMLSADADPPVDRPNLSKDYLAGNAPEDWVPLRPADFYKDSSIDLRLRTQVVSLDLVSQQVVAANGERFPYDRLLLATGAEPVRLSIPGADQAKLLTLRTLADSRAIIAAAAGAQRALVIGASFIGLEVAASLRARGIEVHVVAPDKRPMERILGPAMGDFIRALHEEHGVVFHLEETVAKFDGKRATLRSGHVLETDLTVAGVGVRPRLSLAENSGLAIDNGVVVNAYLETSVPNVFAAGDIARWPDPCSGQNIRVEHWVVAERQGQTAARNMMGTRQRHAAAPFFWSQHYDVPINYVGHAERWDEIVVDGDIKERDCVLSYRLNGRTLAVASIYRDLANLKAAVEMEREAAG